MADGFSFLVSRKSIADHGISLVAQSDCSILRGIAGAGFCYDDASGTAYADAGEPDMDALADFETAAGTPPDVTPATVPPRPPNAVEPAPDPAAYVVAGCFRTRDHALKFAQRQASLHPVVVEVEADGGGATRYLVTADPLGGGGGEGPASGHTWIIGSTPACGMIARRGDVLGEHAV